MTVASPRIPTKLAIEYCVGIVEEVGRKIRGRVSLARLGGALNAQYAEQCGNRAYQYRWARTPSVVDEAITNALNNRFPAG
jgi:hypothetical protein